MKTPADVIIALEATPGLKDKKDIVRKAWKAGITDFFVGATMAYDALLTYGVKKVPLIEEDPDPKFVSKFNMASFIKLADQLRDRTLTGHAARDAMRSAADAADVTDWNYFYRRILLKDLKCKTTDSSINKVLGEFVEAGDTKAAGYIIPVFECQLAKNGEDHPKHMKGKKQADPKLDGVRLVTFMDKDKMEVTQFTRNGKVNDNFPALRTGLAKMLPHLKESIVFDAEVVSRSFQDMMKQLNRGTDIDTTDAKLAVFDVLPIKDFLKKHYAVPQRERHLALLEFAPMFKKYTNDSVYVIPKLEIDLDTKEGQIALNDFNKEVVAAGYEGIMVKDPEAPYICDRTFAWLKIKPWITVDLEVVGYELGKPEGKHAKTLGGLLCHGFDQGKEIEVTVGSGFSDDLRAAIWANKEAVIGRIIEAKGDVLTKSEKGNTWSLRFPSFLQFRGWEPGEKI